jgi:hypothetical protein
VERVDKGDEMSRENTLLAKLGFADADKEDGTHDLACRFLAQENVSRKLLAALEGGEGGEDEEGEPYQLMSVDRVVRFSFDRSMVEVPISKGIGQYKTTIGFMDVVLGSTDRLDVLGTVFPIFGVGVEVKHNQRSIHDAVRQIKLYREYTDSPNGYERGHGRYQYGTQIIIWILATTFDVTQDDLELLRANNVRHLKLGRDFDQYREEKRFSPVKNDLVL